MKSEKWFAWVISKIEDMNESQLKDFEAFLMNLKEKSAAY